MLSEKVSGWDQDAMRKREQQIALIGKVLTTQVRVGDLNLRRNNSSKLSAILDLIRQEEAEPLEPTAPAILPPTGQTRKAD